MIAATIAALALTVSDAPMGLRTEGAFRALFLDATMADARPPARPSLDVRWSFANSWGTPTTLARGADTVLVSMDEQSDALALELRVPWRLGPLRGATSAGWRLVQHWGGWSDTVISDWHRVIQVFDHERRRHPRDRVRLQLGTAAAPVVDVGRPRLVAGDAVVGTQVPLVAGGVSRDGARERWAVALRLDAKAPLGSREEAGGSGGWDGGAALLGTTELGSRVTLHGMAAWSAVSRLPRAALLQPRRSHWTGELSLAVRVGGWALLVEDRAHSALFEGGWRYEGTAGRRRASAWAALLRPQNQVSFGARRGPITIWFSEDITPGTSDAAQGWYYLSNAPDFAAGLAYSRDL